MDDTISSEKVGTESEERNFLKNTANLTVADAITVAGPEPALVNIWTEEFFKEKSEKEL